jgi:nicotinamidase-related amidase
MRSCDRRHKETVSMDALIIVDMQVGLLKNGPKHDLGGVVRRINRLAELVRSGSGKAIFIQHHGAAGEDFAPGAEGWQLLPELDRRDGDLVVAKSLNDSFAGTELKARLDELAPQRVLVAGWATDFCVDATVRSAVAHGYHVVPVADGHTLSDRPHLKAPEVIRHHNWVWSGLIANGSVRVTPAADLLAERA